MFTIQVGSEAHLRLAEAFHRSHEPRKISLAVNEDEGKIAIKIGEGMWSPPLDVEQIGGTSHA